MSDETPPPSLRLKPRQRAEGEAPGTPPPAAPPPAAPAAATPAPEADTGKLRLKPKLSPAPASSPSEPAAVPAPAAAVPPPPPAVPPAAPAADRIRLKPKLNVEPAAAAATPSEFVAPAAESAAPAAAEPPPAPAAPPASSESTPPTGGDEPKVRLKIRIPGAVADAAEAAGDPGAPPPFPVVAPEGAAPPPLKPGVPKPPPVPKSGAAAIAAAARRARLLRVALIGVGGLIIVAIMIKLAMMKFVDTPASAPQKPRPPVRTAPVTPPPAPVVEKPKPAPVEPEPAPAVVEHPRTPKTRAKNTDTSNKVTTDLAPGVTVTTEGVQAEVEASQSFRTFVADAKVSGVFQGTPARAFINGRLVRAGEVVDSSLGIRFDSVDVENRNIVFKDTSGAKVSRRY